MYLSSGVDLARTYKFDAIFANIALFLISSLKSSPSLFN